MKIAVIEDEANHVTSIIEKSTFSIYEARQGQWKKTFSFVNTFGGADGISQLHAAMADVVRNLADVRMIVSTKVPGIATSHFETAGIGVFIVESSTMDAYNVSIENVLDLIEREVPDIVREAQRQQADQKSCGSECGSCHSGCGAPGTAGKKELDFTSYTGRNADGVVTFDMIKALAENPGEISKTVLIPFLKQTGESPLDISCAHLPKWFDTELKAMGYTYTPTSVQENSVTVRLTYVE